MALDEPKDNDNVYDIDGFKYVVEKEFMERVKPIRVDFMEVGFKVDCGVELGAGAGCSSCGSTGTCS